jgi:hypothetical protein
MAYIYDTDILAALWTANVKGDLSEPYATFIADNPTLTDEDSENRILSTIEAIRSHMEVLSDRDEARLFHFCISTMLEGFGSGGFIYGGTSGNENAVVEGNKPNAVYDAADEIEFWTLGGVSGLGGLIALVAAGGTSVDDVVAAINGTGALTAAGIFAARTQDSRLRIFQTPVGAETAAAGFIIVRGGVDQTAANDNIVTVAGIVTQEPGARAVQNNDPTSDDIEGGYYLAQVTKVANEARDRALLVFQGQIRDPALT